MTMDKRSWYFKNFPTVLAGLKVVARSNLLTLKMNIFLAHVIPCRTAEYTTPNKMSRPTENINKPASVLARVAGLIDTLL